MKVDIHHSCTDFNSYRAARVKSLFNADSGCNFDLATELPIDDGDWKVGVIVGPSGSGKSSLAEAIWPGDGFYNPRWPKDEPIIDAIGPARPFDDVPAALSAVGLGSVPTWLRPFHVLSTGEKFRASCARLICDAPARAKLDEFTSTVDRQIAKFGAMAFAKAWRRTGGQVVLCSCHYDIIDWIEPCWVFDTATGKFAGRGLWRRPRFELEVREGSWSDWPMFETHHYLKLPHMVAAFNYLGYVAGEPVAHVAVGTRSMSEARACRLVVMPEWQGAGVGMRFLNAVCELWLQARNRYQRKMTTLFHTSHPGLCAALRRDPKWKQISAVLYGNDKRRSAAAMAKSGSMCRTGFGGHFRAVQGFRYYGEE